jgi:hypothetical protein
MTKSKATNPTRMPAPLARESSRLLRSPGAGRRVALSLPRRSGARSQDPREPARLPSPDLTGSRSFLARRALRQLTRGLWPPRIARPA